MDVPAKVKKLSRMVCFRYWQVLDIMEDRFVDTERWKMQEVEVEEKGDFWGFEELGIWMGQLLYSVPIIIQCKAELKSLQSFKFD